MIKAVFLDFYGTLVKWSPDAEQIQQDACAAEGLAADKSAILQAYPVANAYLDRENAKEPLNRRSEQDRDSLFAEYERRLLAAAGLNVTPETALSVWRRVYTTPKSLSLYDDARPALNDLHAVGLTLGVISNIGPELGDLISKLGITDAISVWASSAEAGANKPHAAIFELALAKAGVAPIEALHVGDSYESDVKGARNASLHALLLWRDGVQSPPEGVPVVTSLLDVIGYLRKAKLG